MASGGTGAVFFLGSRAHYQVLQQPPTRYDLENGNTSTETVYQNPSVQELWPKDQSTGEREEIDNQIKEREKWTYEKEVHTMDEIRVEDGGLKRRPEHFTSETALCENETDIKPAMLNVVGQSPTPKPKPRRKMPLMTFLSSLARRKKRLETEQIQYLQHIESVLMSCTYRESCRCLDCQSRYFEVDDSDDYSSDDSDYFPRYISPANPEIDYQQSEDDDEVYVESVPEDNTSTDLLIDKENMSISSDEVDKAEEDQQNLQLEVAAGTPIFLNYLLTHPITCAIQ